MRSIAILVLLLASCSRPNPTPEGAPGIATASSRPAAEFRWFARSTYEELIIRSCGAQPGFSRQELLARERDDVRAFEESVSDAIRAELETARADVTYQQELEQDCFADEDPSFAKLHVEDSRRDIKFGLKRLRALAHALNSSSLRPLPQAPQGAALRYSVRHLIGASQPLCDISRQATNDQILAPTRVEIGKFRERLKDTPYAAHFDVAEADALFEKSIVQVECGLPYDDPVEDLSRKALSAATRQIAAIEALIRAGQ